MKTTRKKNVLDFVEHNFEVHGEFNGIVYHQKRNGEQEKYPYKPVSYYQRTPLVIRNEAIRRFVAQISNPRQPDYQSIIKKLNYYTPYILNPGTQEFMSETAFYVREKGEYEFCWQGAPVGMHRNLGKSTQVKLSFHNEGEFSLDCWLQGELYCRRIFMIIASDLETAYNVWLTANLEHILSLPEPEYESIKTYRRGLRSKVNWITALNGRCKSEILYEVPDYQYKDRQRTRPWLYHRKKYDHTTNPQTQYFNNKIKDIGRSWQLLSQKEQDNWNEQAARYEKQRLTGFNLYTRENML